MALTSASLSIPGLDVVLARLDLGRLRPDSVVTLAGRNESWAGRTDRGHHLFIKRFGGPPEEARQRMRRSAAFERLAPDVAPRVFWWDERTLLMVSEFVDEATTGADLAADGEFGPDLALRAGRLIGSLHGLDPGEDPPDRDRPVLPSAELLRGLPLRVFRDSCAGELKAWRLMQEDAALAEAVDRLLTESDGAPAVPAHCDLRLDQFLIRADRMYVIDWEEFRLSDAARDVGSFAGELLHRYVSGWAEPGSEPHSHEDVLDRCAAGIEQARPVVAAFWSAYRAARACDDDPGLAARAAAFAGWHMYDRLLAGARRSVRLSAVHRAAAGIGRTIMSAPAAAAPALGLAT
jgi:aminoglycoside phosphotransferase (APT) family kinase protein